jgi:hypothetical protein
MPAIIFTPNSPIMSEFPDVEQGPAVCAVPSFHILKEGMPIASKQLIREEHDPISNSEKQEGTRLKKKKWAC